MGRGRQAASLPKATSQQQPGLVPWLARAWRGASARGVQGQRKQ